MDRRHVQSLSARFRTEGLSLAVTFVASSLFYIINHSILLREHSPSLDVTDLVGLVLFYSFSTWLFEHRGVEHFRPLSGERSQGRFIIRRGDQEQNEVIMRVIARIADEMKNPLVAITTFGELFRERHDDPKAGELFAAVRNLSTRMRQWVREFTVASAPPF